MTRKKGESDSIRKSDQKKKGENKNLPRHGREGRKKV